MASQIRIFFIPIYYTPLRFQSYDLNSKQEF